MSGSTRRTALHEAAAYLSMAKEFQAAAEESAAAVTVSGAARSPTRGAGK